MICDSPWHIQPSATGRQLVLFPFLGGFGASFNHLAPRLSGDWDVWAVNPPGHGPSTAALVHRLDELVRGHADSLRGVLKPGAVFFGHSMGGIVAHHVLAALTVDPAFSGRIPTHLVLSATVAPRQLLVSGIGNLSDAALLEHLRRFTAIPDEVANDPSMVEIFLPSFRADYHVLEDARTSKVPTLDVPGTLILGALDTQTPAGTSTAWQTHFVGPIQTHVLKGEGHMFITSAFDALDLILNNVAAAA